MPPTLTVTKPRLALCGLLLLAASAARGQGLYNWTNFAGSTGGPGYADGRGRAARFQQPRATAVDADGNVYVADSNNSTIRKITSAGVVTTLAGSPGSPGSADGTGSAARFKQPYGVTVDANGNVYVADTGNDTIRKITSGGEVTTLAGLAGSTASANGAGSVARFYGPYGVAVDGSGNLYVADTTNCTIRKITNDGVVSTLAGSALQPGSADGSGNTARFRLPKDVAVDGSGNVYVSDTFNGTIRKITSAGVVTTLAGVPESSGNVDGAGNVARFYRPEGIAVDGNGNVYVADVENYSIRKITGAGVVSTLTSGYYGTVDGPVSSAEFETPEGLAIDGSGNLYVAESHSDTIRKITSAGVVTTLAGSAYDATRGSADGAASSARFNQPQGVALDGSGNLYVADSWNRTIRKISSAGVVTTVAGAAGRDGSADGRGSAARFNLPYGVAVDASGNLYVADSYNHTIRKITGAGVVTTLAGRAGSKGSANGTGRAARFNNPEGVAVDGSGNVYVADSENHTIRKITAAGVVSTLAGVAGKRGFVDGTGSVARFSQPNSVALDASGNLYVADESTVRKITSGGVVATVSAASATGAYLPRPACVTVDGTGNLYAIDRYDHTIRRLTSTGLLSTIGGRSGMLGNEPGVGQAARFYFPMGLAVGAGGRLYVAGGSNQNIVVGTPDPDLTVEQPAGAALTDGVSIVNWGNVAPGQSAARTFTVRNDGANDLTGLTGSIVADPAGDFVVTTPLGATSLAAGASTSLTVTFTPVGMGTGLAGLKLASNDPDKPAFTIGLQGTGADVTAPQTFITSAPAAFINTTTASIAFSSTEEGNAAVTYEGKLDGNAYAPATSPVTLTALAPGAHSYSVHAVNAAGVPDPHPPTIAWTVDTAPPAFTFVPPDMTAYTDTAATAVVYDPATATDESGGPVTITYSAPSGSLFPPDLTTVTATATDIAGNSATANFTVTLRLNHPVHTPLLMPGAPAPGHGTISGTPDPAFDGPPDDAILTGLGVPAIDDDGNLVFRATWTSAGPPVRRGTGIFTMTRSVAQTTFDTAHEGTGFTPLNTLGDPVIGGGHVAFLSTPGAVWSGPPDDLRVVAVTYDYAPDATGFRNEASPLFKTFRGVAVEGESVAVFAQLTAGNGGLRPTEADDWGLWLKDATHSLRLVLREGQLVSGRAIKTLVTFAAGNGSPGQGRGWLTQTANGPRVLALATLTGTDHAQTVLSAGFSGVTVLAQNTPGGLLPGITDATFASFGLPTANAGGTSAFLASLAAPPGGPANAANARGIFVDYGSGIYTKIARVTEAAGATGTTFSLLKDPVLAEHNALAFPATLKATATVKVLATTTLWSKLAASPLQLLAQGGARPAGQPIPGLPIEAQWRTFPSLAIAAGRGPIFSATRGVGKGGVTAATASGVWAMDYAGVTRLLFQTGIADAIVPGKTLKSFTLLKTAVGSVGVTRSFNDVGQLVWLAAFTDRTTALIMTDIP
jgi:sugar lactone lactonase YvrE